MAVMENWEDVELNVDLAMGSEGTIQEQYEKWQTSFESASTRLTNTLQQLYEGFLDSDVMIAFVNILGDIVNGVGNVIESFGGFGNVLLSLALIFNK